MLTRTIGSLMPRAASFRTHTCWRTGPWLGLAPAWPDTPKDKESYPGPTWGNRTVAMRETCTPDVLMASANITTQTGIATKVSSTRASTMAEAHTLSPTAINTKAILLMENRRGTAH